MKISFVAWLPLVAAAFLVPTASHGDETRSDPAAAAASDDLALDAADDYELGYALAYREARLLSSLPTLLVKGQRREIDAVTRDLAHVAESIVEDLEAVAEARPSIVLENNGLPPVEAGARARMEKSVRRDLLLATGCHFEKRLLFVESMGAGKLLALIQEMTAGARDSEESEFWHGLGETVAEPHERVLSLYSSDCAAG